MAGQADSLRSVLYALFANAAIAAESVSLWGCMREVNKERCGRNLWQWFRHSRSSALIVVFGPDAMVATINSVEREFRTQFPIISWLFFEPDVED